MICIRCGQLGHKSTSCQNPTANATDRAYLRALVYPHKTLTDQGRVPPRGTIDVQGVQLYYGTICSEDASESGN